MARHLHGPETISIPNGGTDSPAYKTQSVLGSIDSMVIFVPAALTGVVTLQVAHIDAPQAADWLELQWQPGTAIALTVGKAVNVPLVAGFRAMRFHSTLAEGAQRDFKVGFQIDADYGSGLE